MKRLITVAAISLTLLATGCSSDSDPASQAATPTATTPTATTPSTTTPSSTTPFAGGLIIAGGFEVANAADIWFSGNGSINIIDDSGNKVNSITIPDGTSVADEPWHRNIQQELNLTQGKSYKIKFKAKSDRNRVLDVGIGENKDPYTAAVSDRVNLTTEWMNFEVTLEATTFGGAQSRIFFNLSGADGLVMLDDVYMEEVTAPAASLAQVNLPVSFEGATVDYTVNDFGGVLSTRVADPAGGSNMVMKTVKGTGAGAYAGTTIGNGSNETAKQGFASVIPFTSTATTMSMRVYSPESGVTVRLKVEKSTDGGVSAETDALTTKSGEWEDLVFDLSNVASGTDPFDAAAGYDKASVFFGFEVSGETVGEKVYHWDDVKFGGAAVIAGPLVGTWKIAPEAGSLAVGDSQGASNYWALGAGDVTTRACLLDDTYTFNGDGTFVNGLGADTWVEGWQGGSDACADPVAPHNAVNSATYTYDAAQGKVTLQGVGAYLGLAKPVNGSELASPGDAPASIEYEIVLSDNDTVATIDIAVGGGVWWRYKLVKDGGNSTSSTSAAVTTFDFESAATGSGLTWTVFENGPDPQPAVEIIANPHSGGINTSATVAKFTARQVGQQWAGAETAQGEVGPFMLSSSNSIVKVMVYKTVISDVGIKLVTTSLGAMVEKKVSNTVTNAWEELTFDFSDYVDNGVYATEQVNQFVIFPDFAARSADTISYFDNAIIGSGSPE